MDNSNNWDIIPCNSRFHHNVKQSDNRQTMGVILR